MDEEFKHHDKLNKEADLMRGYNKKGVKEFRQEYLGTWITSEEEGVLFPHDDSNRVFSDEDIKKCQEAFDGDFKKHQEETLQKSREQFDDYIKALDQNMKKTLNVKAGKYTYGRDKRVLPDGSYEEFMVTFDEEGKIIKEETIEPRKTVGTQIESRINGKMEETWTIVRRLDGTVTETLIESKPLEKRKQRIFNGMQPQLSGVYPMGIDIGSSVGANPCAEVPLPGYGSCIPTTDDNTPLDPVLELTPKQLKLANRIEDRIEQQIKDNYESGKVYLIEMTETIPVEVFKFIKARMYNWTITTEGNAWKVF